MKQTSELNWQWLSAVIFLLMLSRLIPHPPNFTPIGAMAVLAGLYFKDLRSALLVPLLAMLASDLFLGLHSSLLFVYGAIAFIVWLSFQFSAWNSPAFIVAHAFISAVIFFLVTNFGAWLTHEMYPHTFAGLAEAYVAGIPFFKNSLLSNLLFCLIGYTVINGLARLKFSTGL